MTLFRSASGPGGLSINTSSANMFSSSTAAGQAPAATGGLFGSATQTANASTPKPGGLFGSTMTAPTSQTAKPPSLFASTASAQPQPQQQTSSLFGMASQPQSQPTAQPASLFGATPQTQTQTQTQTQPQPQAGGGLFAMNSNATTTGQANMGAAGGLGLFGGAAANPSQPTNNAMGNNLLGMGLGQSTQQRPSVFGGFGQQATTQTQPSTLGQQSTLGLATGLGFGLTMGQPNQQPTVPGVRIDYQNIKGTTRFNDLQEDVQKMIEQADHFIAEQVRRKDEVNAFMSGHRDMLESIPNDVTFVARKYDGARNSLESAAQSIEAARALVNQDADHARLSFRAIDNLKLPQQYHTSGFWSPRQQAPGSANAETDGQDLVGFFSRTTDEMEEQMKKYERNLTEIEHHMHGVSDNLVEHLQRMMAAKNGAPGGANEQVQELVAVLNDFEQSIFKVAGDVGSVREGMTRLQLGDFMSHDRDINSVY